MIDFIMFWCTTVIVSFGFTYESAMKIIKDLADEGYKIKLENLNSIVDITNTNNKKQSISPLIIPLYNIMWITKTMIDINNKEYMIINILRMNDLLEEMTEIEKEEYEKKKTGFNAMMVSMKMEKRIKNANKIVVSRSSIETGEIIYEIDKFKNITILKTTGYVSRLSKEEQKKEVIEYETLKNDSYVLKLMKEILDLNEKITDGKLKGKNRRNQIEELKKYSNDLKNDLNKQNEKPKIKSYEKR